MTTDITPENVARWPQGGYAPGGYMCKCSTCGKMHQAEKRAWQCADCVIQRLAARLAEVEAENAKLREALAQMLIEYDEVDLAEAEPPSLTAAVFAARAALQVKP